tara:strand:- start:1503 stop:3125 length:1623 start_codon:yes stop_codon:yes gene_type:complete
MTSMNTFGLIGLTEENVGIDRRFYTGLTSTNGTFAVSYNAGRVDVFLNGIKLVGNHTGNTNYDYTMDATTGTGSSITLATGVALVSADVVECIGYVSNSSNTITSYNPTPASGDGGWNVFINITHTASDLVNVFLNGVLLDDSDYTLDASNNKVTIGGATLTASDVVVIQVIGALDHSNFVPVGGGTFSGNVGIGGTADELLHLKSSTSLKPVLKIENTNDDNLNAQIHLVKSTTDESNDDYLGQVDFKGMDSAGNLTTYGRIQSQAKDVANTSEDGRVFIASMNAGTLEETLNVQSGKVGINTTSPDANSKLHISGGSSDYHTLVVDTTASGGGGMMLRHSASNKGYVGTAGSTHLSGSSTDDILIRATNNLVFASNGNNERMRITSDGYVTIPNQPIFYAYLDADETDIVTGGWRNIPFDSLDFACSHYNTTNHTFTTPVAGKYQFNYNLRVDNVDAGHNFIQVRFTIGGSTYRYQAIITPNDTFSADPDYMYLAGSTLLNLGASTAVTMDIYCHGGANQTDIVGSVNQSAWSGFLIG